MHLNNADILSQGTEVGAVGALKVEPGSVTAPPSLFLT